MAESGLTLGWPELKQAVGYHLGYGTTINDWSTAQATEIEEIVQTGYRRVLYPPAVAEGILGYQWSFLRPTTTLSIVVDDGDYDLPDDFGSIVGEFHYAPDEHRSAIQIVSLAALLDMRSHSDRNSYPTFAAIRFKDSTGSAGQRQEVLFYPEPDASYTLYYSYDSYQGALSDSYPYPLGGMQMSELYKEACLAVAEARNADEPGAHTQLYQQLLLDAVTRDRRRGAQNFGQMGEQEVTDDETWRRGQKLYGSAYSIEYKGSQV